MIIRHKDSSAVSHWSRDFVEHLRSVHFALTTLSVALVIVLLSTGDAQLDKAFTQAAQIEALLHRWKDVQARAYESATQAARLPIGGTVNVSASLFVFEWDPTTHMFVPGKRLVGASLQVAQQQFTDYEEWKFPGSKMLEPPSTLGEFRSWWNELNRGISVLVPNFASDLKSCDAKISNRPRDVVKCSRTASQYTATSRSFRWVIPKSSDQEISLAWDVGPPSTGGAGDPHIVELLTAHELRTVRISEQFLTVFHSDWRKGTYEVAFQELGNVSSQLQELSITIVRERIQEMQSKAEERFEAFGLRIPAAQVVRWGIALLLAAQLYFWIHLHELTRKLRPNDPGWEVAWIGMYSSKAAFIATMISSTFLPALAALMLGWRFWRSTTPGSHGLWTTVLVGALVAAALVALATAFKLFRLRSSM